MLRQTHQALRNHSLTQSKLLHCVPDDFAAYKYTKDGVISEKLRCQAVVCWDDSGHSQCPNRIGSKKDRREGKTGCTRDDSCDHFHHHCNRTGLGHCKPNMEGHGDDFVPLPHPAWPAGQQAAQQALQNAFSAWEATCQELRAVVESREWRATRDALGSHVENCRAATGALAGQEPVAANAPVAYGPSDAGRFHRLVIARDSLTKARAAARGQAKADSGRSTAMEVLAARLTAAQAALLISRTTHHPDQVQAAAAAAQQHLEAFINKVQDSVDEELGNDLVTLIAQADDVLGHAYEALQSFQVQERDVAGPEHERAAALTAAETARALAAAAHVVSEQQAEYLRQQLKQAQQQAAAAAAQSKQQAQQQAAAAHVVAEQQADDLRQQLQQAQEEVVAAAAWSNQQACDLRHQLQQAQQQAAAADLRSAQWARQLQKQLQASKAAAETAVAQEALLVAALQTKQQTHSPGRTIRSPRPGGAGRAWEEDQVAPSRPRSAPRRSDAGQIMSGQPVRASGGDVWRKAWKPAGSGEGPAKGYSILLQFRNMKLAGGKWDECSMHHD